MGKAIAQKFGWNVSKRQYSFIIGAVLFGILSFIPIANFLAGFLLASLGWGVIVKVIFGKAGSEQKPLLIEKEM